MSLAHIPIPQHHVGTFPRPRQHPRRSSKSVLAAPDGLACVYASQAQASHHWFASATNIATDVVPFAQGEIPPNEIAVCPRHFQDAELQRYNGDAPATDLGRCINRPRVARTVHSTPVMSACNCASALQSLPAMCRIQRMSNMSVLARLR